MDVRKQMRQLTTDAHQLGGFHVMPRVALSSKHHCFSPGKRKTKTSLCFDAYTHAQHTSLASFSLPPSLAQAISQSRFSLAYYTLTDIPSVLNWRRTRCLIILVRSCYRDQTCDLFWLWAALPLLGHLFSHSLIHSLPSLCLSHAASQTLWC